ncbi:hypothetical protein B0T13DRAFT_164065 [Neurospora crassa]|nr:hypothetical protein B0T13DRAFT_164065 [Neurospora crassa]
MAAAFLAIWPSPGTYAPIRAITGGCVHDGTFPTRVLVPEQFLRCLCLVPGYQYPMIAPASASLQCVAMRYFPINPFTCIVTGHWSFNTTSFFLQSFCPRSRSPAFH